MAASIAAIFALTWSIDSVPGRWLSLVTRKRKRNAMKEKRITIPISKSIDEIRGFIAEQTGVEMTYTQVINYLIHFYVKHANEPRTKWAPVLRGK